MTEVAIEQDTLWVVAHPDVVDIAIEGTTVTLHLPQGLSTQIECSSAGVLDSLQILLGQGMPLDEWRRRAESAGREAAAAIILDRLMRSRLLIWWFGMADRRLLSIDPLSGHFNPTKTIAALPGYRLSDMVVVSYWHGSATVNDPLVDAVLGVTGPGLALIPGMLAYGRPEAGDVAPLPRGSADFLARCGFLRPPGVEGAYASAWTPWEWWSHRQNRNDGAIRRTLGSERRASVPIIRRRTKLSSECIVLPRRSADTRGPSLSAVMEARRSLREPTATPLTIDHLGAVLWTVARNRDDRPTPGNDYVFRNVPLAGALGEMDFYVAINRCDGLDPGFYAYDGSAHGLVPVAGAGPDLDRLIGDTAKRLYIDPRKPDCVIVLAIRQARLSRKYYGGAYRLATIHVGVVYEALYLAATELGVSPCAAGFADMFHFARLTGRNPMEETSLGEFALSGPADADLEE